MTGFARIRKTVETGEITISVKSVNHRGLDLHFHLPPEFDPAESDLRAVIRAGVARGHLQINVVFQRLCGGSAAINHTLLGTYIRAFREAAERYGMAGEPDLNAALRMPGMFEVENAEDLQEDLRTALIDAAREAVAILNRNREREGAATADEMRARSGAICGLVNRMEEIRGSATPAFQQRLRERLDDLLKGASLDPQRLAQEAALLTDRSDISEELTRLRTHAQQLDQILAGSGEVGKRLDFLLQEMNREANTILSKTGGLGDLGLTITDLGLAAKSEIDKLREQSLNLE